MILASITLHRILSTRWIAGSSPAMTLWLTSWQGPLQQSSDVWVRKIDSAVHAGVIPCKPGSREQFGMTWRDLAQRSRGGQQRELLHRQPRHALGVRSAEGFPDKGHRIAGARQARGFLGETLQDRGGRIDLARQRAQHVQAHHIARAFPDRIDGRFPVMPRQNALLDIAIAAE